MTDDDILRSDCPRALGEFLAASADIANAVGDRIYPEGGVPQDEHRDRIIISETSFDPEYSLAGEIGIGRSIITIDYWAENKTARANAKAGGELIRNRISAYRGMLSEHVEARSCLLISGPHLLASAPTDGSAIHRRRSTMDVEIIHTTSVPTHA